MIREPSIPLFLWIATAILVHLTWGGGAQQVSERVHERMEVRRFAEAVSQTVRRDQQSFEVTLQTEEETPEQETTQEDPEEELTPPPRVPSDEALTAEEIAQRKAALEHKSSPPPAEHAHQKEPEKKLPEIVPDLKTANVQQLELPKRIAVQQQVEDTQQTPNPNAEFIGDHDNHVQEQTQARITSTEQNDPKPAPGGQHAGPTSEPGDSHVTETAQLEDREGVADRAPGNPNDGQEDQSSAPEASRAGAAFAQAQHSQGDPQARAHRRVEPDSEQVAQSSQEARAAAEESEASPEVRTAVEAQSRIARAQQAQAEQPGQQRRKKQLPPPRALRQPNALLGLGSNGTTQNGVNLNLSHSDALATVGKDQLSRQILADGERRRSKHRGSWKTSGLERWRSAIENYVPHVKPGNQTALNTAQVPFAAYLNKIHLRLHPIFADQFLGHLDDLPGSHPLNRMDMHTELELVISRTDGSIIDRGVTKASGVTAFDIGVLDSVHRAAPFGPPPSAIVSPDGNVYLHWEFYRDPKYACSTYFAHPKMLRAAPGSAPVDPASPLPIHPTEDPVPNQGRQGFLLPHPEKPALHWGDSSWAQATWAQTSRLAAY